MTTARPPSLRTMWMRAVALSDLEPLVKLVAYTIGQRMSSVGAAHPGKARIAQEASLGLSTVKRARQRLLDDGLLSVAQSGGGRSKTTHYQAEIPVHLWTRLEQEGVHTEQERGPERAINGSTPGPRSKSTEVHKEGASRYREEEDQDRNEEHVEGNAWCRCRDCRQKPSAFTEDAAEIVRKVAEVALVEKEANV